MKKLLFIFAMMAFVLPQSVVAQEMYKVLSTDGKTLTFYYDDQQDSREGTVFTVDVIISDDDAAVITKAVFDPSFADARPTRTFRWFNNMKELVSIENISDLNTSDVTDMSYMFYWCEKLTSLDASHFNTSNATNMRAMFSECISLTSLDVSHFDTSNVTDMSYMFDKCSSLATLDVSFFDTSNVIDMDYMFNGCSGLTSLDVSHFNTSNVTDMGLMFYDCSSLTSLDVSHFDTSKVESMYCMFDGCSGLTSLDVSHFDTSKVENMSFMFKKCKSLTSLNVSNFDTSNVYYMGSMFNLCIGLSSLDMSNFDTSKVLDMSYMFNECSGLTSLDVSHFDTSNVTNMENMFYNCRGLTSLDVSHFDTSNVTDMGSMFEDCRGLMSLDVSHFDTSNVTDMYSMFTNCRSLTSLDLSHFDTSKVTNMKFLFYVCESLTSLDLSHFDTSNVTNMGLMFLRCKSLTSLDVSHFDTSKVTDMEAMFEVCCGLTSLDVTNFDTSNVTNMKEMFCGCSGLTSLDVSHFDTSNVTSMYYMFGECSSLTSLDLSHFDTSKVTDMRYMFYLCSSLTTIYCYSDWSQSTVLEESGVMFYDCTKLQGGNGTTYSDTYTDITYARPDTKANPGYFTLKTPFNFGLYSFRLETDGEGVTSAVLTGRNTEDPRPFTDEEIGSSFISLGGAKFKVIAIGDFAFESDQSTEPMDFTRPLFWNVTRIGEHAFEGCKASTLNFRWQSVVTIGDYAFANTNIREFETTGQTGHIGNYAFQNCTQLERIRSMGMSWSQDLRFKERCFQNCTALKTIEISSATNIIEDKAFAGCTALQRVTAESSTPLAIPANVFEGSNANATLRVPSGSEEVYASTPGWNYFTKINSTDEGATFEDAVFSYVIGDVQGNLSAMIAGLSSTFEGTVAKLPARYVEYEGATFPVEMVANEAFFGNETLTEVDLTVLDRTEADDGYYWWRLDIGDMAFSGCENLESFKCDVTRNVGEQAFAGSGLKTVSLPHLEYTVGRQAFYDCKELTTANIGGDYSPIICEQAFANCPKLSSFVMSDGFYGMTLDKVFYNDQALASVTLSEGLNIYGVKTFQKCKNLRKVVSKNPNPDDIADDTFEDLPEDAVLVVPPGTVELYKSKTGWNHFVINSGDGVVVGISDVDEIMRNGGNEKRGEVYNLNGQRIDGNYRGIVVVKGKKVKR